MDKDPNISQFAKQLDKDPSYVRRVCKRLSIEGYTDSSSHNARLLSPGDRAKLRDYFAGIQSRTSPGLVTPEIVAGNHRVVQDAPIVPTRFNLAQFRGDQESVAIAQPLEVVDRVTQIVTSLKTAMRSDLDQQQAQLLETQQAIDLLTEQEQSLRDEALAYRIQSNMATQQQTRATERLNTQVGKLQALAGGDS